MADFEITVDTTEMARSIDGVSHRVSATTTAVVAMQSAVVAAQEAASRKICSNVDNGFYTLMRSQLSQKIAECYSVMYSKKQLMETFREQIDKIMVIMQDDYNRIKRRYTKQFTSLDKALETRIHELDKRAYELSRNNRSSKFRNTNEIIKTIVYNDENQTVNAQTVGATVKSRSTKAIGCMTNDILENVLYTKTIQHILTDKSVNSNEEEYIPVIVTETDSMLSKDSSVNNIYVPQDDFVKGNKDLINKVQSSSQDFGWQTVDQNSYDSIRNNFMNLCASQNVPERVAKEMIRMFDESKWSIAEAGATKETEEE